MRLARIVSLAVPVLVVLTGCPSSTPSDPCLDVTCGAGSCVPTNGQAQCICNTGYVPKGLKCEQASTEDVCQNSPCSAFPGKQCQAVNGFPQCLCPENTFETDAGCIPAGPCAPNPCGSPDAGGDPNKTVCSDQGGTPVCSCNAGHAAIADGGCDPELVFDCNNKHDGGFNDDQYEPDECPTLARTYDLTTALPESHTIAPASDADWFKVSAPALHIIEAALSTTSSYFWIDVYKPDGYTQVASARTFTSNPTLRFQFSGEPYLYVRIKSYSPSFTGSYTITMSDVGSDDFTNDYTQALPLSPPASFSGNIQYAGDVDIVKTTVPNGRTYQYNVSSTATYYVQTDALEPNGSTIRKTMSIQSSSLYTHVAHGGASGKDIYLKAHAASASPNTTGAFTVNITDLGLDDYGDVVQDATTASVTTANQAGVLERSGDIDAFKFTTTPGHIYRFNCAVGTYSCNIEIRDESSTLVASQYAGSTTTNASAKAGTTAGTWYVFVSYSGSSNTAYTYRLEDLGTNDDHADTMTGATGITVGTAQSGNVEASNDHDWFSFSAQALHSYNVTCTSSPSTICSQYRIVDSTGTTVGSVGYNSSPASANITTAGTYYVELIGGSATGSYTITVQDMGSDPGDTISASVPVTVGTPVNGGITSGSDEDWFSFSATAGRIYKITCTSTGSGNYPCYGQITDSSGSNIKYLLVPGTTSSYYGATTEATLVPTTTGTYHVRMDYYASTYSYSLSVTDLGTDDHPNTTTGATAITVGGSAQGNIQYGGDVDYLQFTPQTNHIYKVVCTTSATGICQMYIYDQNTSSLGSISASTSSSLTFAAGNSTTIYIRTEGSSTSYTGAYTLALTDEGVDDHTNVATGATPLTVGTPAPGNIQYSNDIDVFSVVGQLNHIYRATCTTTASGICRIRVRDPNGSSLTTVTYGTSTVASWVAATAGTYTVEIYGLSGSTGAFTVTAFDDGADDHPNTGFGTTTLSTTSSTPGNIQYSNDVDVFSISATANTVYTITCTTSTTYLCNMNVKDTTGTTIKSVYYGSTVTVAFKALTTGTYALETYPYTSGVTGSYTLTMATATDDFPDTSPGQSITFGSGTNGGIQYAGDLDVFNWAATPGKIYQVSCTGSLSTMCYLVVRDGTGTTQATATGGTSAIASYKANGGGFHSVEVQSTNGTSTGTYTITVTEITDDHGDGYTQATTITPGSTSATGNIQYGADVDFFGFTATNMHIYQFSCTSTASVCGLELRDVNNGLLQSVTASTNRSIVFTAASSTSHYIKVFGTGSTTGQYTYLLQDLGTDDHGNTINNGTTITVGASPTAGIMEVAQDKDMFILNATAGNGYKVRCQTSVTNLCVVTVRTPTNTVVGTVGPSTDAVYEFNATLNGQYSIEVGASNATGNYTVLVANEDGSTYQTATAITAGTAYNAYMGSSSDVDFFSVSLSAGSHTLTLPTTNYWQYTTIYDTTGTVTVSGGTESSQYSGTSYTRTFTTTAAGTYYIRVRYYSTSSIGAYSVLVQ